MRRFLSIIGGWTILLLPSSPGVIAAQQPQLPLLQVSAGITVQLATLRPVWAATARPGDLLYALLAEPPIALPPQQPELAQLDRPTLHGPAASPKLDPESLSPEPQTTSPTLPPLPHEGPSTGEVVAISVAPIALVGTVLTIAILHHGHSDYTLEASGWQFQLTLPAALPVDIARVNAAAARPPAS